MKVIEASYEILPDMIMIDRIEAAGRVAYKSEDKMTDGSAEKFVNAMIKKGHWPVLDMGCVNMVMTMGASTYAAFKSMNEWAEGKYLFFDVIMESVHRPGDKVCLFSGSPRALTEYLNKFGDYNLMRYIAARLQDYDPVCFSGLKHSYRGNYDIHDISFVNIDHYVINIPPEVYKKHKHVGVKFIHNRAFTHEIVRHRPCGFIQESQRYCRYANDKFGKEVTFIEPSAFDLESYIINPDTPITAKDAWVQAMYNAEKIYLDMLDAGCSAQAARTVLPNSCKTEITVFCNLMQWEHMLRLRPTPAAEPSMRQVMIPLCKDLMKLYPMIDIETPPYQ